MTILEALKEGDHTEFKRLLEEVNDINQLDEQGWTLLNWAAGLGDLERVKLLVDKGADVFKRGQDNRTPYLIALAAGEAEIVKYLQAAEEENGADTERTSSRQSERRAFCKAFTIGALKEFPSWTEERASGAAAEGAEPDGVKELPDEEVVFLHQDYSVTQSVLHGRKVVFSSALPEWRAFCRQRLGFQAPTDLDLLSVQ